jgi:hypothetical protein
MLSFLAHFGPPTKDPETGGEKFGDGFEPVGVYDALLKRREGRKGRQEDATEFFGFLLDGLQEEFLSCGLTGAFGEDLGRLFAERRFSNTVLNANQPRRPSVVETAPAGEDDWQEVGPKNRTANTRSVGMPFIVLGLSHNSRSVDYLALSRRITHFIYLFGQMALDSSRSRRQSFHHRRTIHQPPTRHLS